MIIFNCLLVLIWLLFVGWNFLDDHHFVWNQFTRQTASLVCLLLRFKMLVHCHFFLNFFAVIIALSLDLHAQPVLRIKRGVLAFDGLDFEVDSIPWIDVTFFIANRLFAGLIHRVLFALLFNDQVQVAKPIAVDLQSLFLRSLRHDELLFLFFVVTLLMGKITLR